MTKRRDAPPLMPDEYLSDEVRGRVHRVEPGETRPIPRGHIGVQIVECAEPIDLDQWCREYVALLIQAEGVGRCQPTPRGQDR